MLEGIKNNIEKLIALYENEKSCLRRIEDLEHQVDNLRLTEAFMAPAGSDSGAKEKIDRLIKEIDKCISLMEN